MVTPDIKAKINIKQSGTNFDNIIKLYENVDFSLLKYSLNDKDIIVELKQSNYTAEIEKILSVKVFTFKLEDVKNEYNQIRIFPQYKEDQTFEVQVNTSDVKYNPTNIIKLIKRTGLLRDKGLKDGSITLGSYVDPSGMPNTYTDLEFEKLQMDYEPSHYVYGFTAMWWFIIPPIDHPERNSDPFISDEVLLNAPIYKAEKLPSGAIMMQLTKDYDVNKVDHEYIYTYMNFHKYIVDSIEKKKLDIPEDKNHEDVDEEKNYRKIIIRKNKQAEKDLEYIFNAYELEVYKNIQSDDNNDEYERLDKSSIQNTRKQITHFYEDYDQYLRLLGLDEKSCIHSTISIKSYDNISEYELMYLEQKPIHEVLEFVEQIGLLDDPDIFDGCFYLDEVYSITTVEDVSVINPNKITYFKYGFYIYWWFIIPPKGHPERPIDPFENDDIFLKAPVYKAQRLKSGATLIQLTENYDYLNPDNQEYIDTLLKFNEYLKNNMKK